MKPDPGGAIAVSQAGCKSPHFLPNFRPPIIKGKKNPGNYANLETDCPVRKKPAGACRDPDVVTRYGEEEFAIILPETDGDGAWTFAETVRQDVERSDRFLRRLTVSCGITALRGVRTDPQILVEQADQALCRSKSLGRNRSTRFEEGMQESAYPYPLREGLFA